MNEEQPTPQDTESLVRPQESLLRSSEQGVTKRRPGEPEIFLSWEGKVYGPAAPDDVRNGIRASFYEEETTFWFEGMDDWRPLEEFPESFAPKPPSRVAPRPGPSLTTTDAAATQRKSKGKAKKVKPPKPRTGASHGLLIVILFCLLAVGLTVGVILLLTFI